MSFLATLLRLLLCFALILNGSVPMAHAAVGGTGHATAPVAEAPVVAHDMAMTMDADHGCHDGAAAEAPPAAPMPSDPVDQDGTPHDDGCCGDEDTCRSACAQHCAASIPSIPPLRLLVAHQAGPLPMPSGAHPDPRLSDHIRPPIA